MFLCYIEKGSNRPNIVLHFTQLSLYSVKWIFFNYQVFEIESFRWVSGHWISWSVCKWSVVGWLVVGGSVVGGFNKTHWKTIWKDASYTGHNESSSQKLTTKKGRDKVKFTKTEYQLRLSFVIYAVFESVLGKQDSYEPSSSKSFTTKYQHHLPCGSCIYVKCSDRWYFEPPQVNRGNDAAEKFLD